LNLRPPHYQWGALPLSYGSADEEGSEYPIIGWMSSRPVPLPPACAAPIGKAMTSGEGGKPDASANARKGCGARAERLRAALRENLKRRKAQARGRAESADATPHDSAGFVPDKSKD
jgi:hypothetical protein